MKRSFVLFLLAAVALFGCGGSSGPGQGDVAGVVFDEAGNPVRGAHVYIDSQKHLNTTSSTSGSYVLTGVPAQDVTVRVEVTVAGTRYFGSNVARISQGEQTRSINLVVYPDQQLAAIEGVVQDRNGFLISGARVFARQNDGQTMSSGIAVTDDSGYYKVNALRGGQTYAVVANAGGYGTDSDTVTLTTGQTMTANFTLANPTNPSIPAPTGVSAQSWTAPLDQTRGAKPGNLIALGQSLQKKRSASTHIATSTKTARNTVAGNLIEVDLTWTRPAFKDLLGYGIYRAIDNAQLHSVDFLRDPLAEIYEDSDSTLFEQHNYTYNVTSINTSYDSGTGAGESNLSNATSVLTLGDLVSGGVTTTPLTFHWVPVLNATGYVVYIFYSYPYLYQAPRFSNFATPATGSSFVYNGPALQSGTTYYYMLMAVAAYDAPSGTYSSNSLSAIGTFTAP